jgi:hypothetical protein
VIVSVLRSIARRRVVETENPSACATVGYKVCKSATATYLSVIKRGCVTESNHPNYNPSFRQACHPARDNIQQISLICHLAFNPFFYFFLLCHKMRVCKTYSKVPICCGLYFN